LNKTLSHCENSDSSSSGSGSASGSDSEKSDKSDAPAQSDSINSKSSNHSTETKIRNKSDSSREWDENPDIYGIRRSARSRKEPDRLTTIQPDSDNDGRKKLKKKR
jgi:chromodomain-helicase-DNA-binding protein 1